MLNTHCCTVLWRLDGSGQLRAGRADDGESLLQQMYRLLPELHGYLLAVLLGVLLPRIIAMRKPSHVKTA